jgi:N-acetylneuraminate lyase
LQSTGSQQLQKKLPMNKLPRFTGLIAAPFAPMDEMGALAPGRIDLYYSLLEKNGVQGAFINGSTGEGVSLTTKERMIITEHWTDIAREKGTVKVINLVGGTSAEECIEQARHSASVGTDAIAVIAPFYFKPSSVLQLVRFVARVAESVPDMPVYFYHIPVLTGCNFPMIEFLRVADGMIPNLVGIKFTQEDFMDLLSCLNFMGGKYEMLAGRDECLLSALVLGVRGAVGSTYNYAAPLYNSLISAYVRGDLGEARRLQMDSIRIVSLLGKYGGMSTGKAFMRYIGLDCGEFRLPFNNMSHEEYGKFTREVESLGLEHLFSVL